MAYPYTGTNLDAATRTGLSTQIIIKVDGVAVGAMQTLTAQQRRQNKRHHEIGTDGVIEITPENPTSVTLSVTRIVFDRKSLPEAMGRAFANIHAQRVPFDIFVYDFTGVAQTDTVDGFDVTGKKIAGLRTTVYEQCWFNDLSVTYSADNYIISQTANIDVTAVKTYLNGDAATSVASVVDYKDIGDKKNVAAVVERVADTGRRGSLDARGLMSTNGLF